MTIFDLRPLADLAAERLGEAEGNVRREAMSGERRFDADSAQGRFRQTAWLEPIELLLQNGSTTTTPQDHGAARVELRLPFNGDVEALRCFPDGFGPQAVEGDLDDPQDSDTSGAVTVSRVFAGRDLSEQAVSTWRSRWVEEIKGWVEKLNLGIRQLNDAVDDEARNLFAALDADRRRIAEVSDAVDGPGL
jgi:hypothetical protein